MQISNYGAIESLVRPLNSLRNSRNLFFSHSLNFSFSTASLFFPHFSISAFITFENASDASRAVQELQNHRWGFRVEISHSNDGIKELGEIPNGGGGGGGRPSNNNNRSHPKYRSGSRDLRYVGINDSKTD